MKKIIKGYLYDTDKSIKIHEDKAEGKIWYRTKNRRYFVYYSRVGQIQTITEEAVMEHLGICNIDDYIAEFGEVEEA